MAGATYRLDRAAFEEHLLNAPFMVAHMKELADGMQAAAEAIAPVDESSGHPGRYRDSFQVESGAHGGKHDNRAYAILWNTAPEALAVEFGTENNDAHHTLAAALSTVPGTQYKAARGSNTARDEGEA
jgi:hypothetical protein